jgi:hypothetical protein
VLVTPTRAYHNRPSQEADHGYSAQPQVYPRASRAFRQNFPESISQATSRRDGRRAATGESADIGTAGAEASAAALLKIQYGLELIRSAVVVVARALMEQNCELDDDAARVLRHHVTDSLTDQMVQISLIIDGDAS